ncbi:MAG TPA: hypothetical protein VEH52_10870 [Gaiellaceae bacterium]|nr:hypothetical protein [Gaiellaceae bacterium]
MNVPESNWVLAIGLGVLLAGLVVWSINAWLARPRPVAARGFE